MSNPIRYDSLLVHYLARELDDRLAGRRLRGVRLDPENRRFALELDEERLVWELHPTRGRIRIIPGRGATPTTTPNPDASRLITEGWTGRDIRIQRRARVLRVSAPLDERILEIRIDARPDRASRFVIELMTNQWNVLALEAGGRIVSALWPREAGGRVLRSGEAYALPGRGDPRAGADAPLELDEWREIMGAVEPGERRRALVRGVAWTSPLNAPAILGGAAETSAGGETDERDDGGEDPVAAAWERYRRLVALPEPEPRIVELDRPTLYPLPLEGVPDRPITSLLAGMEELAKAGERTGIAPEVRDALESRREDAARRAERLRTEAEAAPGRAADLRRRADLLMAQLHRVERGAKEVELDDFEGGVVALQLDPRRSAAENAEAMYDRARKRERAADRLPARVREAIAERNRLDTLLEALERGDADPQEVERWAEELRPAENTPGGDEDRLPYRAFRSSGGLEIRVGRSSRGNDALTFHHSSPDDIWLHARDMAGAHVILRWPDREQNPPRRDLVEAAVLAALHSRGRSSGTVPVDWTRRKYVRKPRKAPPGAVLPDRVETVFVEPDPGLPERLS